MQMINIMIENVKLCKLFCSLILMSNYLTKLSKGDIMVLIKLMQSILYKLMQTSSFEDPDCWASSLRNFIPIKQAHYLNMSCAIFAIVCMDNVTFPKEPPVLLKAGAEAWPSTSDTG